MGWFGGVWRGGARDETTLRNSGLGRRRVISRSVSGIPPRGPAVVVERRELGRDARSRSTDGEGAGKRRHFPDVGPGRTFSQALRRRRTPGLESGSPRNSIPWASRAVRKRASVSALASEVPSVSSSLRMVAQPTPEISARSLLDMPSKARDARIWLPEGIAIFPK
jgi:hypothetical protein